MMRHLGFYKGFIELSEIYQHFIGVNRVFVTLYTPGIDTKPPERLLRS